MYCNKESSHLMSFMQILLFFFLKLDDFKLPTCIHYLSFVTFIPVRLSWNTCFKDKIPVFLRELWSLGNKHINERLHF